ncbi:HNH endonuclease [Lactiplantibacillus plantarum]|uniref:HNH endonuclease n=1 Tax=Lactiplantibacillus plantarum TaxID=1590 RepID=UPI003096F7A8
MAKLRRCRAYGCHQLVLLTHWYCETHRDQEATYLASRQKWARSHQQDYQSKYNHVTRYRNEAKAQQYQFYKSKQWQALRTQALKRDHYLDQYALAKGQYLPANTVDHIVPIEIDNSLRDELDNLASCSRETHKRKTAWEQSYYGTGRGNKHTSNPIITDKPLIMELANKLASQQQ